MDEGPNPFLTEVERSRLESARIGIAGAGGLGSNCAMHLVRAGVTHLTIADFDVVAESNLNRQFFFRNQIGRKKVYALAENLWRINVNVKLVLLPIRLTRENFAATFADCDILVEAFDSADAKAMFLASATPLDKPMVMASGIAGWGRSAEVVPRMIGGRLIAIGDGESGVGGEAGLYPVSPRVGIAAAMEANAVCSIILGHQF